MRRQGQTKWAIPSRPSMPPSCHLGHLDDVEAHVDDVLSTGAVVSGSRVTLEGIAEIPTVQVVVTQVIMAAPVGLAVSEYWSRG